MLGTMRIAVVFDTPNPGWEDPDFKEEVEAEVGEPEYEVAEALMANGHEVYLIGVHDDVGHLLRRLEEFGPDLVFNCLESFMGTARFDYAVTALLDMHGYRYTGSSPETLLVARDKATSKKILSHHDIRVPRFRSYAPGQSIESEIDLEFPLIVKPRHEDASVGIARASVVAEHDGLLERVGFIHRKMHQAAIAEELIDGREFYVGLLGNDDLQILPIIELTFDAIPKPERKIATYRSKWDLDYRERWGIKNIFARRIAKPALQEIEQAARTAFHALELRDYGRVDFRLTPDREVYLLEVNPNPYISFGEDMANAAERAGLDYYAFVEAIVRHAMSRYDAD